jgi:DNA-binding PadR family transcriptional regulator
MSVRLVLLGLLLDSPKYGYELKHIIEDHMGDWTSIAFGSIYFALDKLSKEEFIEKVGVEQPGNRPSRSVYGITDNGKDEFYRLLRESWQNLDRQYYQMDICLFFMEHLAKEEIRGYIQGRLRTMEGILRHLDEHEAEEMKNPDIPAQARAIFSHTRLHTQAEVAWLKEVWAEFGEE